VRLVDTLHNPTAAGTLPPVAILVLDTVPPVAILLLDTVPQDSKALPANFQADLGTVRQASKAGTVPLDSKADLGTVPLASKAGTVRRASQ